MLAFANYAWYLGRVSCTLGYQMYHAFTMLVERIKVLTKHLKIQVMVMTDGTSLRDDIMRLYQPVHLLVGTPGRILDLAKKGVCILKDCSMLIMDEVNMFNLLIDETLLQPYAFTIVLLYYYSSNYF